MTRSEEQRKKRLKGGGTDSIHLGVGRLPFLQSSKMHASSFKDDYLQTYSYCGQSKEGAWPSGCEGRHSDIPKRYLEIVKALSSIL